VGHHGPLERAAATSGAPSPRDVMEHLQHDFRWRVAGERSRSADRSVGA
jgi:hypothetical protein